jgi:hypothetical protein
MNITELLKKAYNYGEMHQSLLKDKYSLTTFLEEHKEALNFIHCSTQFNALLQKETEVIYKSVKYYIFLIDYNKEVASIKQVEGTWIEYNVPFKQLTKSI